MPTITPAIKKIGRVPKNLSPKNPRKINPPIGTAMVNPSSNANESALANFDLLVILMVSVSYREMRGKKRATVFGHSMFTSKKRSVAKHIPAFRRR